MTGERIRLSFLDKLVHRPSHRRIAANVAWLFIDKVIYGIVGILVGAWVARYLGPASFGLYCYALAFVYLLNPWAGLGLRTIVIRNIVREPQSKDEILSTALVLRVGASILVFGMLLAAFAVDIGPKNVVVRSLVAIVSVRLLFDAFSETLGCWFEADLQARYVVWARNGATIAVGLVKIGLILCGASLIAFAIMAVTDAFVFACGVVVLYRFTGNRFLPLRVDLRRAKELLRDSWPLIFYAVAVVVYMKIDQIMLGHLASEEALGNYSAAVRLSEIWYFIPTAVAQSLFPAIVRSRKNQRREDYDRRMQAYFDMMIGIAYLVIVPLILCGPMLVAMVFGPDYTQAGSILRVHVCAFLFVTMGVACSKWLITENLMKFQLAATTVGAVTNIALNFLLIPRYAGMGAAWATLISYAVAAYLSSLFYGPARPVFRQLTLALFVAFRLPFLWTRPAGAGLPTE